MEANGQDKWRAVRKSLNAFLLGGSLLGSGIAVWAWGVTEMAAMLCMILCLALGFWLTEMLIGVFTAVKKANATAIVMLFAGKLAWWGALFAGIHFLPRGAEGAVGLGIGIFLLALLFASIQHYGMPRISDGNPPRDP